MPDHQPLNVIDKIRGKASVHPPGIVPIKPAEERLRGPVRILWAARWEHDKNPEDFFAAMKILKDKGLDFRLNVIGEQFRDRPEVFNWARKYFADHIVRWGYQSSKEEYQAALIESDIVVSTANHEFFGIGMLETMSAGCFPLLPKRLSYPAIIESLVSDEKQRDVFLYDGTVDGLVQKLQQLITSSAWVGPVLQNIAQYNWPQRAGEMDQALLSSKSC